MSEYDFIPTPQERDDERAYDPAQEWDELPTNTWQCRDCGATVERYRGMGDVSCGECGALYNSGGQRLRDDAPVFGMNGEWGTAPWVDNELDDLEAYEREMLSRERYDW